MELVAVNSFYKSHCKTLQMSLIHMSHNICQLNNLKNNDGSYPTVNEFLFNNIIENQYTNALFVTDKQRTNDDPDPYMKIDF